MLTINDNRRRNLAIAAAAAAAVYLTEAERRRDRRRKRLWVKLYRANSNDQALVRELREDHRDDYKNYLRMDSQAFDEILKLVENRITKQDTVMRRSITAEQRLIATLRYLATGRSYEDLKFSTGISAPSLSKIIPETCKALYQVLRTEFLKVTCQDEKVTQCIPKRAFLALLRLPEVSSNLAAYSRIAKVIQDANKRNDMAQLRALTKENDDTEICIRGEVYLELFKDPALRGHVSVIGRTQKLPDLARRQLDDSEEIDSLAASHKRSLATLAKNDDLPISLQDRLEENHDDEEKRTGYLSSEQSEPSAPEFSSDYMLPSERLDLEALVQDFPPEKRNVGSLARDFALPPGRRNIASLVRDYELQTKENVENRMLPVTGKRNVASLARTFTLPQTGKENVASIARGYALPYSKRYVGALVRTGDFPSQNKRSIASLSKNSAWPVSLKRGITIPGSVILRTLSRHGRSLIDELNTRNEPLDLHVLNNLEGTRNENHKDAVFVDDKLGGFDEKSDSNERINFSNRKPKRQIYLSDEYSMPVIQNIDGLDYEEMMEALARRYQNAEKRFMGRIPQMGPRPTTPPTRRQGH